MQGFFTQSEPDIAKQVIAAGHQGIHNFSLGTLDAYFGLTKVDASFSDNILVLDGLKGSSRRKVFAFRGATDLDRLAELQKSSVIYSIDPLDLPAQSKFKELAYDITKVLNPLSYPNADKRAKRLTYPINRLRREGVTVKPLADGDFSKLNRLHNNWCAWKLEQPTTFKMMFPKRRYINCFEHALQHQQQYRAVGAFAADGELLGARALYIDAGHAFDLAQITAAWKTYTDFAEHFNLASIRQIMPHTLNCGAALNHALHSFKAHWPHYEVVSYAYARQR